MKTSRHGILVLSLTAALAVFLCAAAGATDQLMRTLPAYERFGCAICHVDPDDDAGELNVFGSDYAEHLAELGAGAESAWDAILAGLDSDRDGCANGLELGDVDGNGLLDEGVAMEGSNPGLPGDCQSVNPLDPSTWGSLKAMFDSR